MIKGNITEAKRYETLYPGFREAFAALRGYTEATPLGKHPLKADGQDGLYANVQAYESKSPADAQFENHHRYIDIQYIISGAEKIRVASPDGLVLTSDYDPDGDYELYAMSEQYTDLDMQKGDFAILFPGEPHAPGIHHNQVTARAVHKVVVKVPVV